MLLGVIADDLTGASDVANALARGGMDAVQFVGVPAEKGAANCTAGVVALKTRSVPAAEAVHRALDALAWLQGQGCRQVLFKYCSTFDSTPDGNIGPVAEALLDRLGGTAAVCPAFPGAGRTVYMGHLFVGDRLLSESGMERHPLTPMTDPDLRRWLARQVRGPVGLVSHPVVARGGAAIRAALEEEAALGRRLVVVDALTDADLLALGEAVACQPLVTGGSGVATGLPANFRALGLLGPAPSGFPAFPGPGVVLSGSCSATSNAQVARYAANHPAFPVAPAAVMASPLAAAETAAAVIERLGEAPIVYSTAEPETVAAAQARHGREAVALAIEGFFGELARRLVEGGVRRLVVGGGETSGAVVGALGLERLRIGPEIDPGVPALAAEGARPLGLALKSGNFGALDFYAKALAMLEGRA